VLGIAAAALVPTVLLLVVERRTRPAADLHHLPDTGSHALEAA
jgi:hypothetical protein